jgi:hypothetical protein
MRRNLSVLILAASILLMLPFAASALAMDLEAKGGGGLALGTTDDKNTSGEVRWAAGGGVGIDLYLLDVGPVALGLSAGVDYSNLNFHGVTKDYATLTERTTDSVYNYLNFPFALKARLPINESLSATIAAGGFVGYFLGGTTDLSYDPEFGPFVNGDVTLDEDTTEQWEWGLHFAGGMDIALGTNLFFSPSIQFDMGLTDTSVDVAPLDEFKDTFWSLTLNLAIKYRVF